MSSYFTFSHVGPKFDMNDITFSATIKNREVKEKRAVKLEKILETVTISIK